ncbi:hypothetical protein OsI_32793 [Oryza sativa Indica Group]|jgi:hypothetical protein|uniref:Uncharacterized protein n=1 Tax=Oryza sativa subsp. indica TaxID=39946 RepID=A2Z570_ORYSI|nr:hypothetical protein OsI_32793 [Oryza sativa Indica Group]
MGGGGGTLEDGGTAWIWKTAAAGRRPCGGALDHRCRTKTTMSSSGAAAGSSRRGAATAPSGFPGGVLQLSLAVQLRAPRRRSYELPDGVGFRAMVAAAAAVADLLTVASVDA